MWGPRRYRETSPKQKRLNEKKAKRYFEALVEANFKGNRDLVVHPTFSEDKYPESEEAARREVKNWINRLNYQRRKRGIENCKYIIVFEKSPKGRMHFHVLMDGRLPRELVEEKWTAGFCNADRLRSDPKIGLSKIIGYLSRKNFELLKKIPEDSEYFRQVIEHDNPGYELQDVERSISETGQMYLFCRMRLKVRERKRGRYETHKGR